MKKCFEEFNGKECLRTNIYTTVIFIVSLIVCIALDIILFKISQEAVQNIDNPFVALLGMVIFLFLILLVLIIYSIIITRKIKMYSNMIENIKSLIGLIVCNIGVAAILYAITTIQLATIYIATVFVLCSFSLATRYFSIKRYMDIATDYRFKINYIGVLSMKGKISRAILGCYDLFLAAGAIYYGSRMVSGKFWRGEWPEVWAGRVPFTSWFWPGVIAIAIYGVGNLIAAYYSFSNKEKGWIASAVMGSIFFISLLASFIVLGEGYLATFQFILLSIIQLVLTIPRFFTSKNNRIQEIKK